jgi:trimeric autotransporter adhesin
MKGNVGIGTDNPQAQLHITGQFQSTQANSTTSGGGQIYLNGADGNRIDFNTNGVAAPAFTTRSAGTKIVLYPNVGASDVDYAFGVQSSTLWYSIPSVSSSQQHRWYGGTTQLADLKGSGEFLLGSSTLTGTASQKLQVTGGAYVSGNLGIGRTNPGAKLHEYRHRN